MEPRRLVRIKQRQSWPSRNDDLRNTSGCFLVTRHPGEPVSHGSTAVSREGEDGRLLLSVRFNACSSPSPNGPNGLEGDLDVVRYPCMLLLLAGRCPQAVLMRGCKRASFLIERDVSPTGKL